MLHDLKQKYEIVFARETAVARSVAAAVIRPKPLSVWEVLIPVIFILMFMKSKQEREVFVQNLMFTKKMALEAAFKMLRDRQSVEEAMAPVERQTKELLSTAPEGIYSERIRREQLKEIRLLIDHYARLLGAEGSDFKSLVCGAYPSFAGYSGFLQQLSMAESQVNAAATETLGAGADTGRLAEIETTLARRRISEAEEIYASG